MSQYKNIATCPHCKKSYETNAESLVCGKCFMTARGSVTSVKREKYAMVIKPIVVGRPKEEKIVKKSRSTQVAELWRVNTPDGIIFFYETKVFEDGEYVRTQYSKQDDREGIDEGRRYFIYDEFRLVKGAWQRTKRKFKNFQ